MLVWGSLALTISLSTSLETVSLDNIAYRQEASQSVTLGQQVAALAVDGDIASCSLTPRTSEERWWQVKLFSPELIQAVSVTIQSKSLQHFTIFVIELLEGNNALYKPCSEWQGQFTEPRVVFNCNDGKGHYGDFVYIRDERAEHEHLMLCEVEVRPYTRPRLGTECPDPVSPLHGFTVLANYQGVNRPGSVARYHCSPGYRLKGLTESQCGDDGKWSQGLKDEASCDPLPCLPPPHIPNTTMELLNHTIIPGAILLLQCHNNLGRALTQCQPDGSWSSVSLDCQETGWLLSPNIIAVSVSISILAILLVLCLSIILARRRTVNSAKRRKLSRLHHSYNHSTKEKLLGILTAPQEKRFGCEEMGKEETSHDTVMRKYSVKNTLYHKTSPVLVTPSSPLPPIRNSLAPHEIVEDANNNDVLGVYSPMVTIRKDQEAKIRNKMIEDNFEITNKQTDPDYEAIHFNKQKKLLKKNEEGDRIMRTDDLNIEAFDRLETSSALNFSAEKRDLVLGIIRKPEIKPLCVFNKDRVTGQESSKETSLESEVDNSVMGSQENILQRISGESIEEISDHKEIEEEMESIADCPTISNNPFLKNNTKTDKRFKICNGKKQSKLISKKLPLRKVSSNRSERKTTTEEGVVVSSNAAALIRQFNNDESSSKNTEICSNGTLKTTTKKLINKFNQETRPAFPKANNPNNPSLGARTNTQTKKTSTKVQQMVSAFNKSSFLQNKNED